MNREGLTNLLMLTVGAAIGSLVTWKLMKDKYEQAEPEDEDDNIQDQEEDEEESELVWGEEDIQQVEDIAESCGYFNYTGNEMKKDEEELPKPYVISPDDFGEIREYDTMGLFYFIDGVVTDIDNHPFKDVEATIGSDWVGKFGMYEDDAIHVRNDVLKTDYEILLDYRRYSDLGSDLPFMEDEE